MAEDLWEANAGYLPAGGEANVQRRTLNAELGEGLIMNSGQRLRIGGPSELSLGFRKMIEASYAKAYRALLAAMRAATIIRRSTFGVRRSAFAF